MRSDEEDEIVEKLWSDYDECHAEWRKAIRRRRDGSAKPGEVDHYFKKKADVEDALRDYGEYPAKEEPQSN